MVEVLAHMVATMVVVTVTVVHETKFLHVNCVDISILLSSSATKGLIQHIWGKKRVPTLCHPMVSTPTSMQIPMPQTMSLVI
jgi:hypothetical protein